MNFIEYVKKWGYGHSPSALSQIYYLNYLFTNKLVVPYENNIVIGKPFGSSAYYYVWEKLGYISPAKYHPGVKASEIPFVDYGEETLGNALGFASGMELGNKKLTWVNLSDGQMQMGPTLEAIQFIGRNKQNIKVTIDYNGKQLTSSLLTTLDADIAMFKYNGWTVMGVGEDFSAFDIGFDIPGPVVFFVLTKKGDGVKEMEADTQYWHYREIQDEEFTLSDKLKAIA